MTADTLIGWLLPMEYYVLPILIRRSTAWACPNLIDNLACVGTAVQINVCFVSSEVHGLVQSLMLALVDVRDCQTPTQYKYDRDRPSTLIRVSIRPIFLHRSSSACAKNRSNRTSQPFPLQRRCRVGCRAARSNLAPSMPGDVRVEQKTTREANLVTPRKVPT